MDPYNPMHEPLHTIIDRPLDEQTTQHNPESITLDQKNNNTIQPSPSAFTAVAQDALQIFHTNQHLQPIIVQG
jgi:hypothetical protein